MIIDTNILIYDTFEDLDKHKEAREILDSLPEWFVPSIVLIEFIAFLNKSGLGKEKIVDKIEELIRNPKFTLLKIEKTDILKSLEVVKKENLSTLRINDKIILNIAARVNKELITFDRKLNLQFKTIKSKK